MGVRSTRKFNFSSAFPNRITVLQSLDISAFVRFLGISTFKNLKNSKVNFDIYYLDARWPITFVCFDAERLSADALA